MAQYRTQEGDMLDRICLAYYGQASHAVEAVLAANPGLASLGPIYESGVVIELPELSLNQDAPTVRLWS